MAGIITQDRANGSHSSSFEQGFRPSMPEDSPIGPEETSAMYREGISGSDSLGDPQVTRRPRIVSDAHLIHSDRISEARPEQGSRGRQATGRSSLPVTSISHLLSSEPPTRGSERHDNNVRRIICTNCDEWIVTRDVDGNHTNNWVEHSAHCQSHHATSPSVVGDASTSISVTPAPTADSNEPKDTNTAFRRRKVKYYESERLALLERDPQIEEIEEYRVLCAFCERWIHLRKDRPYCPIVWTAHKLQCVNRRRKPGPKPGSMAKRVKREHTAASVVPPEVPPASVQIRRTEEERIKFLVSDPHATTVEPHRILCAICGRWIQLRKNSTYCTAPWVQHVKKCAARHDTPRRVNGSSTAVFMPDQDREDVLESEDDAPRVEEIHEEVPQKRGRGRPRKRKFGQTKGGQPASFALRPVSGASPSPSNNPRGNGRSSTSPPPLRTPSPLLDHPYSNDMYWYPALPPMSSYYPLYAGSQYSESDDSYSLYFHAQPPAHQLGPTPGQGRFRAKPPKQMFLGPGNAPSPTVWHGPPPMPLPTGATIVSSTSPGPDGSSPQPGRAWIVWRLKNYSTNSCPMDPSPPPDTHSSSAHRDGSEISRSGSEPLPMFRSGTWPHLLDPQEPSHTQNLSPYIHPEPAAGSKDAPSVPSTRTAHFGLPPAPPPLPEDTSLMSFNSSAHIPIRASEPYMGPLPLFSPVPLASEPYMGPLPLFPPVPQLPAPDPNIDPRFTADPRPAGPAIPEPPKGADLDSPECRLGYTFQSIAYLFSTEFQGADDMSLDILTAFMNRSIPRDKVYDGEEVSQHVAILGERKQLVFTKEGGVQLLASPS